MTFCIAFYESYLSTEAGGGFCPKNVPHKCALIEMDQCFPFKIIRYEKINIYFAYSVFTAAKMRPAKFFPIFLCFYFVTMHSN
jgi:hypothetical protein